MMDGEDEGNIFTQLFGFGSSKDDFNFKIGPSNYLGTEHAAFKTDMMQLALSSPSEYFKLRKVVLNRVKATAVNRQYAIYYYLLTSGNITKLDGTDSGESLAESAGLQDDTVKMWAPNLPKQEVNDFALKAAKTIDAIAEEAIELLLPMNYKKIAEDRQVQKTAGTLGFNN
jgi:hypothetical protein